MVTDDERRNLYEALEGSLGRGPAATLMALLPPVRWADVATKTDVEMVRVELKAEMAELQSELKGEIAELRGEMKTMLPKLVAANIASGLGIAGLVLAAASLA